MVNINWLTVDALFEMFGAGIRLIFTIVGIVETQKYIFVVDPEGTNLVLEWVVLFFCFMFFLSGIFVQLYRVAWSIV